MAELKVEPSNVEVPDKPPMYWTGLEFEDLVQQDDAFFESCRRRGWVEQSIPGSKYGSYVLPRLQSVVFNAGDEVIGRQWQTAPCTAPLGSDDYIGHFDILVHQTFDEAEAERKSTLAKLQEGFANAEEGSAEWNMLRNKITSYSQPVQFVQLPARMDNERPRPGNKPHVDARKHLGQLQDIRVGGGKDPNVETWDRFAPGIRAMQRAGVLPEGEWKAGTTWGEQPTSVWADEEDDEEEEGDGAAAQSVSERKAPSTFHGFKARHPRPRGLGLGHHGYDNIYIQQRDGVHFTSDDVPEGPWMNARNVPIQFTQNGKVMHITQPLKEDNPAFDKFSAGDKAPLFKILKDAEDLAKSKAENKRLADKFASNAPAGPSASAAPGPPATGKGRVLDEPQW